MKKILLGLALVAFSLNGTPPQNIPPDLRDDYTMNGEIPIWKWYFDNSYSSSEPIIFSQQEIEGYMTKIKKKGNHYYGKTDGYLYRALETHIGNFEGKSVGVIGSVTPWYESIVLAYGGYPTTIEYNTIISEHPDVRVMTVAEYEENPIQFDYLISISSIEHDGLGRYGDPLNPNGDLEAMEKARGMLKDEGLFFLAVPVGPDYLVWNAHRVYGKLRLPLLLQNWEIVGSAGFNEGDFYRKPNIAPGFHQPVFVLRKN